MVYNAIDLTGQKIGFLTVLQRLPQYTHKKTYYKCKCDCGKEIITYYGNLASGHTKSCGCYMKKLASEMFSTHRKSSTVLYKRWSGIKERCYSPNSTKYYRYGARGIKMCDEWKNDFIKFYDWSINNGFSENLTIDRIDVNGDYCPENCKWSNNIEQANNKTNSRFITYKGKTQTVAQWSRETGVAYDNIIARLRLGWDVDSIFTKPADNKKYYDYNGEKLTIKDMARITGFSEVVIKTRLSKKWDIEKIMTQEPKIRREIANV